MFGKGWRGFDGPRERLFEKGDLKYVTLDLLLERPRHGYDIIQALEERFRGAYSPSPGSVYPILQMLEDLGYVVAESREGRKVYTITEAGRTFVAENREVIDEIWSRAERGPWAGGHEDWHLAMHELRHEFKELAMLFGRGARRRQLTPEKLERIREILARTRREIEAVLLGGPC